jgi:predicted secreted protein
MGGTSQSPTTNFVALSTDLTFHLSATTEDSTTKDSTDTTGQWNQYDVTQRSGDIQFSALMADTPIDPADQNGKYVNDFIEMVNDSVVDWKIVFASGSKNRTAGKTLCSGQGKVTNVQMSGQNRQKATFSGTINIFGAVTVGSD